MTDAQYSYLIAAVIGGGVVPTLIANASFLPHHLLMRAEAPPAVTPAPPVSETNAERRLRVPHS